MFLNSLIKNLIEGLYTNSNASKLIYERLSISFSCIAYILKKCNEWIERVEV